MIRLSKIDENLSIYKNKKVIIFGAGITGHIIKDLLESFAIEIYAFCDNNQELWNTKVNNTKVISPFDLNLFRDPIKFCVKRIKYILEVKT